MFNVSLVKYLFNFPHIADFCSASQSLTTALASLRFYVRKCFCLQREFFKERDEKQNRILDCQEVLQITNLTHVVLVVSF